MQWFILQAPFLLSIFRGKHKIQANLGRQGNCKGRHRSCGARNHETNAGTFLLNCSNTMHRQAYGRLMDGGQSLCPYLSPCLRSCTKADRVEAYRKWRKGGMGAPGVKEGIESQVGGREGGWPPAGIEKRHGRLFLVRSLPSAPTLFPTRPMHHGHILSLSTILKASFCNSAQLSQQNPALPFVGSYRCSSSCHPPIQ